MGFLDALRKRSSAVRFSFSFSLHVLSPWPAAGKPIAVAWQRGSKKKKRGVTEAHRPKQVQGQLGTEIEFNEVIQISATLYTEGNAAPTPNGPFKKKCLILAVIESGAHGRDTNALGRVVIDLAEFASMQNEVKKEFPVACSRNILAAVGEPLLQTTIKCMWKSTGGPASMASSMSSDRTGGTFTTNFSAFIRGNENEQIPVRLTGEQFDDLRGFDRLNTIRESENDQPTRHRRSSRGSAHVRTHDSDGFLVEDFVPSPTAEHQFRQPIAEEDTSLLSEARLKHHTRQASRESEHATGDFRFGASPTPQSEDGEEGRNRTGAWLSGLQMDAEQESPTNGLIYQPSEKPPVTSEPEPDPEPQKEPGPSETMPQQSVNDYEDSLSSFSPPGDQLTDGGSEDILSSTELFGQKIEAQGEKHKEGKVPPLKKTPRPSEEESASKALKKSNLERRWKRAAHLQEEAVSVSPRRSPSPRPVFQGYRPATSTPERSVSPMRIPSQTEGPSAYLMAELKAAAFLEYSIYLARPGPQKYTPRNVHAPARRIARGMCSVEHGGEEAVSLLQSCLQAIRAMVEACGVDVPGMSFWWGNCFQLRLFLSRSEGRDRTRSSSPDPTDWSLRRMYQLIVKLEKSIFDRMQQYLWWKVFLPHIASPLHEAKPSQYNEGSVQKWLSALYAVYEQFSLPCGHGDEELGHLHLLRRKIIGNCCRMMDTLLFRELLSGATQGQFFFEAMDCLQEDLVGSQTRPWPKIHPNSLPFKKGPLTFGVGMHLKMAVTRWSEWAIEANMKEPQHTGDPGQSFFPSLKATADLLMMPKELLTDASVRGELFAALSIHSMCVLLEKFQPDEFAPDPVNPDVLRSLTARLRETHDTESKLTLHLQEPPFDFKGDGGDSDSEMDTTFGSESEAEMETLVRSFPTSDGAVSRFELLKDQWIAQRGERR